MLSKIQSIQRNKFKISDSVTLSTGVTIPCITGQLSQVEVISQNGYRYKRGFWDKVLSDQCVIKSIDDRDMLGQIEHPTDDDEYLKTPYQKASHVILKVWIQDGNPFGTFGLLNNEAGNAIKALVDVGHHPGVSTRGLGSFGKDDISQYVSDENYLLLGWDIVTNPNFETLKMDKVSDSLRSNPIFKELTAMHQLKDSSDEHYDRGKLILDIKSAIADIQSKVNILETL